MTVVSEPQGLRKARRQIQAIPERVRTRIKEANRQGVQDVAAAIRPRVQYLSKRLAATVGWSEGLPPEMRSTGSFRLKARNLNTTEKALNSEGLLFTAFEGNDSAFWARWMEYGTKAGQRDITPMRSRVYRRGKRVENYRRVINHPGTPARPHFWPVIRMMRRQLKARVSRAISRGVKEALRFQ